MPTSPAVLGGVITGLGDAFGRARAAGNRLAGFATHGVETVYLGTSTGVRLRHVQPAGTMELVARSADGTPFGVGRRGDLDLRRHRRARLRGAPRPPPGVGRRAASSSPPGATRCSCLPTPPPISWWPCREAMSGRDAEEGRSPFSAPGGGTKIGESLCPLPFELRGDPAAAGPRVGAVPGDRGVGDRRVGVRQRAPDRPHELDRGGPAAAPAVPPCRRGALGGRALAAGRQPDPGAPGRHRLARRHDRHHRTGAAAHVPVVHPRGRPGDAPAHRPHP